MSTSPDIRCNTRLVPLAIVMWLAGLLVLWLAAEPAHAQSDLDIFITSQMEAAKVPGLSAAVIVDGRTVWAGPYGWRDAGAQEPVLSTTPFLVASVSKVVTATAFMHLYENSSFDLDDAIDSHLGFTVRNPQFPETPITFRHLLMHLSSVDDNWSVLEPLVVVGDSPLALGSFLDDYLDPAGQFYDPDENYLDDRPGNNYSYSNTGFSLLGHLVASISGTPFDAYCQQHLFAPLGMTSTGWFLADFSDVTAIAKPHEYRSQQGDYLPLAHFGFPGYPNGQLRSSAEDMAKFMRLQLARGLFEGQRILEAATVDLMQEITLPAIAPDQGLGFYWDQASGQDVVGHNGGEVGTYADFFFDPSTGVGVLLMANGEPQSEATMWSIVEHLFSEASSLNTVIFADGFESGDVSAWQ